MSGGGGRLHRNGTGGQSRDSTPATSGFVLVTSPEQQTLHSSELPKQMAAYQSTGMAGDCMMTMCDASSPCVLLFVFVIERKGKEGDNHVCECKMTVIMCQCSIIECT